MRRQNFPEGQYMQVEVAGITAHAPQPGLARKFLAFMLSKKFQDVIPETNWMFPVAATGGCRRLSRLCPRRP